MRKRFSLQCGSIVAAVASAASLVWSTGCSLLTEPVSVKLSLVAEGLTAPVEMAFDAKTGVKYVVDQIGVIRVIDEQGMLRETPFLDLRDRIVAPDPAYDERGVLGLALHPRFSENGLFYVYYSAPLREGAPADFNHTSHVSEFGILSRYSANPGSERVLLQVDEPQMNHNGGQIVFGPDGYLYIPLGDGGGANDEGIGHVEDWYAPNAGGNGQDITQNLLGSILRIDVDSRTGALAYGIPADNPFVGAEGLDEIWAYGFRNPWRISFDRGGDRELFAADAGQNLYEEASIVVKGGNYGWNVKEGTHCFSTATPNTPPAECPGTDPEGDPLIDPVVQFDHEMGTVIVGGFVYRGRAIPGLEGAYVFGIWSIGHIGGGDHNTGEHVDSGAILFARQELEQGLWPIKRFRLQGHEESTLGAYLLAIAQDPEGELYLLTSQSQGPAGNTGKVYKLMPFYGK